jgi:hypothetical protein
MSGSLLTVPPNWRIISPCLIVGKEISMDMFPSPGVSLLITREMCSKSFEGFRVNKAANSHLEPILWRLRVGVDIPVPVILDPLPRDDRIQYETMVIGDEQASRASNDGCCPERATSRGRNGYTSSG